MLSAAVLPVRNSDTQKWKLQLWYNEHLKDIEWSMQWTVILLTQHKATESVPHSSQLSHSIKAQMYKLIYCRNML